ncbi:MAG: hypothetical protein WEB88_03955 [Gemmatimonadota bacterium]
MLRKGIVSLLTLLLLAAPFSRAEAIPAFARKYGVSCSLCHAPAPRLTPFGEDFAAKGFQFSLDEAPADTIDTGDEQLHLLENIPLAIRLDAYVQALTESPAAASDLQAPWLIKLLSGGQIANKVSYYLYFFMSERGEVAGLEDAYVQFSDLFSSGVDLLVGQFQVSDPLFKRELRLEYEDYQAYRVRVGNTRADLTYDRGLMAAFSPWADADMSVQLLNGRGLDEADETKTYDRDDRKNVAARFSQGFGPLRVGVFGYYGSETGSLTGGTPLDNEFLVYGPDLTLSLATNFELNAQFLRRTDERPFFELEQADTDVDMGFAELVWSPHGPAGRWFFTGLYNHVEADQPLFTVRQGEDSLLDSYRSAAVGANYLLARNLRLTGELQYDLEREGMRLVAGFMSAF